MNATPHTHDLTIEGPKYCGGDGMRYCVRYGDQHLNVFTWNWRLERRMAKKTKRIVKRHDRESVKAGERESIRERAQNQEFYVSTWGGPNADEQERERQRHAHNEWMKTQMEIRNLTIGKGVVTSEAHLGRIRIGGHVAD